jgi:single-strand DNA-binding protein
MHNILVVGRLGRDPEMRTTPSGKPVVTFSLADNGDRRAGAVWFDVSAWGRLAEVCAQYLSKGREVAVQGRLRAENGAPRVWAGSDGQARARFELTAQSVEFLSGGQDQDAQQERAQGEHARTAAEGQRDRGYGPCGGEPPSEGPELQEEIPF